MNEVPLCVRYLSLLGEIFRLFKLIFSAIIKYISEKDDELIDLRVERPSFEERFLEITSKGDH